MHLTLTPFGFGLPRLASNPVLGWNGRQGPGHPGRDPFLWTNRLLAHGEDARDRVKPLAWTAAA